MVRKKSDFVSIESPENIIKSLDMKYASVANDGIIGGDFEGYSDSGSYILNALLSSTIFGGFPNGKIVTFAGKSTTGKTFFALQGVRNFLKNFKNGVVLYFESESAISKTMLKEHGIDVKRLVSAPVITVEETTNKIYKFISDYLQTPEKRRLPIFIVLDSLGNLSTNRELKNITDQEEKADMGAHAKKNRAFFRSIKLILGVANIPFIVTNHTYKTIGLYATDKMSGGEGAYYNSDALVFLGKKKIVKSNKIEGNTIFCKLIKGRLSVENIIVETKIFYDHRGLDRHYGLIGLGIEGKFFRKYLNNIAYPSEIIKIIKFKDNESLIKHIEKKIGKDFDSSKLLFENSKKLADSQFIDISYNGKLFAVYSNLYSCLQFVEIVSESDMYKEPEKYFNKDVLKYLDLCAGNIFSYGSNMCGDVMSLVQDENLEIE